MKTACLVTLWSRDLKETRWHLRKSTRKLVAQTHTHPDPETRVITFQQQATDQEILQRTWGFRQFTEQILLLQRKTRIYHNQEYQTPSFEHQCEINLIRQKKVVLVDLTVGLSLIHVHYFLDSPRLGSFLFQIDRTNRIVEFFIVIIFLVITFHRIHLLGLDRSDRTHSICLKFELAWVKGTVQSSKWWNNQILKINASPMNNTWTTKLNLKSILQNT